MRLIGAHEFRRRGWFDMNFVFFRVSSKQLRSLFLRFSSNSNSLTNSSRTTNISAIHPVNARLYSPLSELKCRLKYFMLHSSVFSRSGWSGYLKRARSQVNNPCSSSFPAQTRRRSNLFEELVLSRRTLEHFSLELPQVRHHCFSRRIWLSTGLRSVLKVKSGPYLWI